MKRVFIIAEAGVNHNGKIELAKELIDAASDAGADAVKFQTFKAEKVVCKNVAKAAYQIANTGNMESQYEMLKKLELSEQMHKELIQYCVKKNILFLSTPFDSESAKMLSNLGMNTIKIPSGEITNLPYLKFIAGLRKKVILSTGMSDLEEVKDAINILKQNGTQDITVLHCNTQYPTPASDVNLLAMAEMGKILQIPIGYSDHTQGIEIAIAAVALGAVVIEKHFTLNRNMEGPDHKASLEPYELKQLIEGIRKIELALGSNKKEVSLSEKDNKNMVRRSIVAARDIKKGEIFTEKNITTKRPGTGISPMKWDYIVGKTANRNYKIDEMIQI